MFLDNSLNDFIEKTGSPNPVPGGGSVSALAGALAASLVTMTAGLTLGRQKFSHVQKEVKEMASEAAALKESLKEAVAKDSLAYEKVILAVRMPKDSELEQTERSEAIQQGFKQASAVPMEVAENALKVLELAEKALRICNPSAKSDTAVGAMMARSAVLGAVCNVRINLASIKDKDFVAKAYKKAADFEKVAFEKETLVMENIKAE